MYRNFSTPLVRVRFQRWVSQTTGQPCRRGWDGENALCGVGLVVHEEQLDVLDVADEESLVAGGHHVLGLLVGAVSDLKGSHVSPFAQLLLP